VPILRPQTAVSSQIRPRCSPGSARATTTRATSAVATGEILHCPNGSSMRPRSRMLEPVRGRKKPSSESVAGWSRPAGRTTPATARRASAAAAEGVVFWMVNVAVVLLPGPLGPDLSNPIPPSRTTGPVPRPPQSRIEPRSALLIVARSPEGQGVKPEIYGRPANRPFGRLLPMEKAAVGA
jgi:hypothetical protein